MQKFSSFIFIFFLFLYSCFVDLRFSTFCVFYVRFALLENKVKLNAC